MRPLHCVEIGAHDRLGLLAIARRSIEDGCTLGHATQVSLTGLERFLQEPAAVFVTLTRDGALRGCIGSTQASVPLVQAVADAAFNAAHRDCRFAPVTKHETARLHIEISVLSEPERLVAESRQALLAQLVPGRDGLILEDRGYRATFLPRVWDSLSSPDDFLDQLLIKAGLRRDHWSNSLELFRYRTLSFGE